MKHPKLQLYGTRELLLYLQGEASDREQLAVEKYAALHPYFARKLGEVRTAMKLVTDAPNYTSRQLRTWARKNLTTGK
jgi:hypothetical protein